MASKKSQATNESKSVPKNILPATNSTSTGAMTRSMRKANVHLSSKSPVDGTIPKKAAGTHKRQPVITLASLGAKKQVSKDVGKAAETFEDSGEDSTFVPSDADSSSGSRSQSPSRSEDASSRKSNSTASYSVIMPVMTTNTATVEEQLAEMARAISKLTKTVEDKDLQIASLMNKLETQNVCESSQRHVETSNPHVKVPHETATMDKGKQVAHDASVASLSVQQLQDMIANSVRAQYSAPNQDGFTYSKPYARRIDNMRMPTNFTPPKLQLFDGKGDPRQHIARFIETCNEAGTYGDLLVKQFIRSLKGNAFEWYTGLDSESIDSWEQMENEFYNRFYSTKRTVSMMELTNTKQLKDEPVIDYINRWRSLSLDCKDRLSEISAVEMCMQGMHWGLLYILQGIKPHSFKELATRAHDMELSIASRGEKNPPIIDQRRERKDGRRTDKFPKPIVKDAMTINTAPVKISGRENKKKETRIPDSTRGREKPRLTLKELEEKEYPFPDSDVAGMLEDLLEKKVIQLPECKRPEEMGRVQDPKYCKFHRIVSHPVEKCFVLKELILNLAR